MNSIADKRPPGKTPTQQASDGTIRRIVLGDANRPDIQPDLIEIGLSTGETITVRLPRGDVLKIESLRLATWRQCGALLRFEADYAVRNARQCWLDEISAAVEAGRTAGEAAQ